MGLLTITIVLLASLEVGYFVKTFVIGFGARLLRSRIHPLQSSSTYGLVTTRDIDFLLTHMNNSRFLRAMDFGRVDHFMRSRLSTAVTTLNTTFVVASSVIRYRKPVFLLTPYVVRTGIVYWDERSIYYRQDVCTLHDNFTRATAYIKVTLLGCTPLQTLQVAVKGFKGHEDLGPVGAFKSTEDGGMVKGFKGSEGSLKGLQSKMHEGVKWAQDNDATLDANVNGCSGFDSQSLAQFKSNDFRAVPKSCLMDANNDLVSITNSDEAITNISNVSGYLHDSSSEPQIYLSRKRGSKCIKFSERRTKEFPDSDNDMDNSFMKNCLSSDLVTFLRYNELSSIRLKADAIVERATAEAFRRCRTAALSKDQ